MNMRSRPTHSVDGPRFPRANPRQAPRGREPFAFDPRVHLQLEAPRYVQDLDGETFSFPVCAVRRGAGPEEKRGGAFRGLAYSAPFRVLSDEGVRALRSVISENEKYATSVPGRIPKCIRGLGYRSQFVHDLGYSPDVLAHLAGCAGEHITPHGMSSNLSQVNFGEIGAGVKVDQWHLDSVPYVMVLLMSDATDMVGGELQVARIPGDPRVALSAVQSNKVDPAFIDTVKYPGPGYAIFMQGSRIAHGVTPVLSARENRLTVVTSYQNCDVFAEDRTVYRTFRLMADAEGKEMAPFEYGRHVAWRVSGQLDHLLNKANYFGWSRRHGLADALQQAADELTRARRYILDEEEESLPYNTGDEQKKMVDEAAKRALVPKPPSSKL